MKRQKAVIFGVRGQDGFYLKHLLAKKGIEVLGVSRGGGVSVVGDVSDRELVYAVVKGVRPDYVFHFAACSSTRHEALFENHAAISTGTLNVLEAVRLYQPDCRVFITGSGLQFLNTGDAISEKAPFVATSAYAVSRIGSTYAARYFRTMCVKAYVGYLFHHESPLRQPNHLCKLISESVKRISQGSVERIRLGDISVRKEVAFAGDIVEGIFALVNQDKVFEATIGTGVAYSVQDWLDVCFKKIGKNWRDYVDIDTGGFCPEYRVLVSDPATINGLGWHPHVGFADLAEMMLK